MQTAYFNSLTRCLLEKGCIHHKYCPHLIREIFELVEQVLKNEPALLKLTTPMNICGDINGHYHDLLRIFRTIGTPAKHRYLFLGNYTDHIGNNSSPLLHSFHLIILQSLPIAAVLANKIFCVHGGLINKIERLDHIKKLEPDEKPVLMKLMPTTGESNRNLSESIDDDIDNKLSEFGVDCIIRGHQVVNGYLLCRGGRVIILYSASSLHQSFNNLAAIAKISESLEFHSTKRTTNTTEFEKRQISKF
ncbi:Calcineurin-like phosphoesterase family protein [Acanthocheilonema viteae]